MRDPKDYIIFPLDVPSRKEAEHFVKLLSGHVGMFKVGLELFIQSGPDIVEMIHASGDTGVFLDLKLHDIPATVSRAVARIAELGVRFATVHCGESPRMLEAAVSAAGGRVALLGVTVLTSVSAEDIRSAGFNEELSADMTRLVMKRAAMAKTAGCAGIVCAGREVSLIKKSFTDFIAVTPGIRPSWQGVDDDQKRIATPAQAICSGSDYLVIGRPIRDADDPRAAAKRIVSEIESAL
jgi:orotidine-5'-phosphate decarboxylase